MRILYFLILVTDAWLSGEFSVCARYIGRAVFTLECHKIKTKEIYSVKSERDASSAMNQPVFQGIKCTAKPRQTGFTLGKIENAALCKLP